MVWEFVPNEPPQSVIIGREINTMNLVCVTPDPILLAHRDEEVFLDALGRNRWMFCQNGIVPVGLPRVVFDWERDFIGIRIPLHAVTTPSLTFASIRVNIVANNDPMRLEAQQIVVMKDFDQNLIQIIANRVAMWSLRNGNFAIIFTQPGKIILIICTEPGEDEPFSSASRATLDHWATFTNRDLVEASGSKFSIKRVCFEGSGRTRSAFIEDSDSQTEGSSSNDSSPRSKSPVGVDEKDNVEFCDDTPEGENTDGE
ncbi:hypothetical protein M7I_0059 [Glarea lozoyensis 74030]|nr:hypothetical protein M7I_0059 [Glarea lozoyensis 74030]